MKTEESPSNLMNPEDAEQPTLKMCLAELRKLRGKKLTDKQWIDEAWKIYKRCPSKKKR